MNEKLAIIAKLPEPACDIRGLIANDRVRDSASAQNRPLPARGHRPEKDEIRFDMFDAEFTHEGDRCTLEVLAARLVPGVAALRPIAEIIHDVDLKDSKFERAEATGIDALITGICTRSKDDEERLQRGSAIFDDLFESFSRRRR